MANLFDDYDPPRPTEFDPSRFIAQKVNQIAHAVSEAQEGAIKDLLKEAYQTGYDEAQGRPVDFEEWLSDLQERIRRDGM